MEQNSSLPPSYILSVVSPSLWRGIIEVVSTSSKATQTLLATSLMRRLLPPHAPKSGLKRLVSSNKYTKQGKARLLEQLSAKEYNAMVP